MRYAMMTAAVVAAAGTASAQFTQTDSATFGFASTNFTETLNLDKFAGNLADLTSITLNYNYMIQGGLAQADNEGTDPASGTVSFGVSFVKTAGSVNTQDAGFNEIFSLIQVSQNFAFNNLGPNDGDGAGVDNDGGSDYIEFIGSNAMTSGGGSVNSTF